MRLPTLQRAARHAQATSEPPAPPSCSAGGRWRDQVQKYILSGKRTIKGVLLVKPNIATGVSSTRRDTCCLAPRFHAACRGKGQVRHWPASAPSCGRVMQHGSTKDAGQPPPAPGGTATHTVSRTAAHAARARQHHCSQVPCRTAPHGTYARTQLIGSTQRRAAQRIGTHTWHNVNARGRRAGPGAGPTATTGRRHVSKHSRTRLKMNHV